MAISTYKIFLMQKNTSAWEKLIDIKEFPDLGGAPEMLETTTLSDKMQTYIPGIQSLDSLEFTANYTLEEYKKLKALEGTEKEFAVWFGGTEAGDTVTPTGDSGKFMVFIQQMEWADGTFYLAFREKTKEEKLVAALNATSDSVTDVQVALAEVYEMVLGGK